jgi:hypothetical protein
MAKRHIYGGKETVRQWVERALQKDFPPIRIIEAEESSESRETSEEEKEQMWKWKTHSHQWQQET